MAGAATAEVKETSKPGVALAVLSLAGCAYALLQSLVVPALPVLQHDLHTSTSGVAWVFTSYLLAASVVTPIAGRLGDMFGKKRVLVIVLGCLAAGSALGGLATTLPVMITARAIQGIGGAIFPLAFGIVRDQFPQKRVAFAIAIISGILGIGGGLGIVLAGPILNHADYHWLFWIPLIVTLITVVAAIFLVPESTVRAPGSVDWLGAALLSGWLIALLLAVSEAPTWGWGSPKTIGLMLLAVALAVAWVWAESRAEHPLVDMTMMRLRGVWTTNLAALLVGFGMYSLFVLIPEYVQAPTSTGYGFGASVTESGFYLIPSTLMVMVFSPIGGRLSSRVGSKVPLVAGAAIVAVAFVILALWGASASVYIASTFAGIGVGLAFAALANLIIEAVRPDQTGVASGMNAIVRLIGGAIGSEIAASILAASVLASGYPTETAYKVVFSVWAVVVGIGVIASLAVPGGVRHGVVKARAAASTGG